MKQTITKKATMYQFSSLCPNEPNYRCESNLTPMFLVWEVDTYMNMGRKLHTDLYGLRQQYSYLNIYCFTLMEVSWSDSGNIEGPHHRQQGQQQQGPPRLLQHRQQNVLPHRHTRTSIYFIRLITNAHHL